MQPTIRNGGRHYLPSLRRGHELQQCNNFMDPGLQVYASKLFETIRTAAEGVFMRLPPPTRYVDMSQYVNRYGGCIYGQCDVAMADGASVKVAQVKKGDILRSGRVVCCMVRSPYSSTITEFCELGDLKITAWHPVYVASEQSWRFPCELPGANKWMSFLLESADTSDVPDVLGILINGYNCAVLGHGVTSDETLAHAFLGTSQVVHALSRCQGFQKGLVTVMFTRSDASGALDGLIDMQQAR